MWSKETPSERLVTNTKTLTGRSWDAVPSLHNTQNHILECQNQSAPINSQCVCVLSVNHRLSASFLSLYPPLTFLDLPFLPQAAHIFKFYHHSQASQNTFKPLKKKKRNNNPPTTNTFLRFYAHHKNKMPGKTFFLTPVRGNKQNLCLVTIFSTNKITKKLQNAAVAFVHLRPVFLLDWIWLWFKILWKMTQILKSQTHDMQVTFRTSWSTYA